MFSGRALLESTRRAKLRLDPRAATRHGTPAWSQRARQRIAVAGAGISGLVSARLLRDLGQEVQVFEASPRVGGRILSPPFDVGGRVIRADAGAARVADSHEHTLEWIRRLHLQLEPMYPAHGRLVRSDASGRRLSGDVALSSSHDVHQLVRGIGWDAPRLGTWKTARALVEHSLLKPTWYRVRGGAASLPEALADTLGSTIRLGHRVHAARQSAGGVQLQIEHGDTLREAQFDHLIITTPGVLRGEIDLPETVTRQIQAAAGGHHQQSAVRLFVITAHRGWMADGVCGWGSAEHDIEIWQPTFDLGSVGALVVVYSQGPLATRLAGLPRAEREQRLLSVLFQAFPGVDHAVAGVTSHCWDEDPWSQGAQSLGLSEQQLDQLLQPLGPIHFAGEYTSREGWIDGAIASAYRVIGEIMREARPDAGIIVQAS